MIFFSLPDTFVYPVGRFRFSLPFVFVFFDFRERNKHYSLQFPFALVTLSVTEKHFQVNLFLIFIIQEGAPWKE